MNKIKHFIKWFLNPYYWLFPYWISFVEEGIQNPKYFSYRGGRMEIWSQWSQYDIDEVRFFTSKIKEWVDFRDKWDLKSLNWWQLNKLKKIIKKNYEEET